jgi:hypothetical protein
VVGLPATGFARSPGFSTAKVLGAWEFIAAVINHVVARDRGRYVRPQFVDLYLDEDGG